VEERERPGTEAAVVAVAGKRGNVRGVDCYLGMMVGSCLGGGQLEIELDETSIGL
jgi:hypothetical protein